MLNFTDLKIEKIKSLGFREIRSPSKYPRQRWRHIFFFFSIIGLLSCSTAFLAWKSGSHHLSISKSPITVEFNPSSAMGYADLKVNANYTPVLYFCGFTLDLYQSEGNNYLSGTDFDLTIKLHLPSTNIYHSLDYESDFKSLSQIQSVDQNIYGVSLTASYITLYAALNVEIPLETLISTDLYLSMSSRTYLLSFTWDQVDTVGFFPLKCVLVK